MTTTENLEQENSRLRAKNSRIQEDLDASRHVFRQMIHFSSRLGVITELTEMYRSCTYFFKDLLQLDFATLYLIADDQGNCMIAHTLGFPESIVGTIVDRKKMGLTGFVLESQQTETVDDFQIEQRFVPPAVVVKHDIKSAIASPMVHNGKVFGILFGYTLEKRVFTEEQKALAQIFANQSATAIKNATHISSLSVSEQKLKQVSDEFETIFNTSPIGIVLLQKERVIARCNKHVAMMHGYSTLAELQAIDVRDLHFSEEQYEAFGRNVYGALLAGKPVQFEYEFRTKNGKGLWCSVVGQAVDQTYPPDLDKGIVLIVVDISQQKMIDAQLLKSQKMESIAVLTRGLAHDFNNIMTAILGNISLSMATMDVDSQGYSFLNPAKDASLRAKELIQKLLAFSKGGSPVRASASLVEIVKDSADFVLSGSHIKVNYNFDSEIWNADIDADQISQVMQSLIINSKDAMPDGGEITISCLNFEHVDELPELNAGQYVRITITDTGHGMSPVVMSRVFDPYFTTKDYSSMEGSGLGLALVQSIINQHDGIITVTSKQNVGTIFTLYIAAVVAKEIIMPEQIGSLLATGKGRILVMDDDSTIREILSQMLSMRGYEVEVSVDGEESIELYKANMKAGTPFSMVIMDLTIPGGMGGKEAVTELLKLDENAKVVVSSGYSEDPVMVHFKEYGFCAAIGKPFEFAELGQLIQSVLMAS